MMICSTKFHGIASLADYRDIVEVISKDVESMFSPWSQEDTKALNLHKFIDTVYRI